MKTKSTTNRRKFLLAAGLGGAGAAVVAIGKAGHAPQPTQAAAPDEAAGYRATEHILKYYKTTQV